MAKFTHGLSDPYLGGNDQSVMEASFQSGVASQQGTGDGEKLNGERFTKNTGSGLKQPVSQGTKIRRAP